MGRSVSHTTPSGKSIVVSRDADVTTTELDLLFKADSQAKTTWSRKLRRKDQSASAYIAALVDIAVRAGWDDQSITNLVITSRRMHGDDFEPEPDYYARVIAQARAGEAVAERLRSYGEDKKHSREEALADLSAMLGVLVTSIQRFHTDPRSYVVRLGNGSYIECKTSNELTEQAKLTQALFDYANVTTPKLSHDDWHKVKKCIAACVEDVESASESTHLGATISWLRTHLRKHLRPDMERNAQIEAAKEGKPAILDGRICFSMDGLKRSIMLESSEQPPGRAILAVRLEQIGCEYKPQVSLRSSGGKNTSRSLWFVPKDFKSDDESESRPNDDEADSS